MSLFLHQTTTIPVANLFDCCCICLYSYIKPQPAATYSPNSACCICLYSYIKPQLKGCACAELLGCICLYSYIKPQHIENLKDADKSCICLYSYIKPQPDLSNLTCRFVVYVSIPTSNHNV